MNLVPLLLALSAAFFWVLGEVIGKLVLADLNTTTFNALGFSFIAIVLTLSIPVAGLGPVEISPAVLALLYGTVGLFMAFQIYFYAMRRSDAHIVATIGNSAPVWTVLFAPLLLGEGITGLLLTSLALVVVGSLFFLPLKRESKKWRPAVPLTLLTAMLFGLNMVIMKLAISQGIRALTFLWIGMISSAAIFSLAAGATKSWRGLRFNRRNLGLLVVSVISSRIIGTYSYLSVVATENVSALAPFVSATVLFAFLLSVLIVGEKPTKRAIIGAVLVFLGVFLAAL